MTIERTALGFNNLKGIFSRIASPEEDLRGTWAARSKEEYQQAKAFVDKEKEAIVKYMALGTTPPDFTEDLYANSEDASEDFRKAVRAFFDMITYQYSSFLETANCLEKKLERELSKANPITKKLKEELSKAKAGKKNFPTVIKRAFSLLNPLLGELRKYNHDDVQKNIAQVIFGYKDHFKDNFVEDMRKVIGHSSKEIGTEFKKLIKFFTSSNENKI